MINRYWTKERVYEEALKYKTRYEFAVGSPGAWNAAQRNGWLDEVCTHMEFVGSRYERAVYFIRSNVEKIGYIGLSMAPKKRYRQHLKTNHKNLRPLLQNPHEIEILTAFMLKDEAAKMGVAMIKKFKSEGWTLLNSKTGGGLGGSELIWTKEAHGVRRPNMKPEENFRLEIRVLITPLGNMIGWKSFLQIIQIRDIQRISYVMVGGR